MEAVGRPLITLLLCANRTLQQLLLYLSLFFKRYRDLYYNLLNEIKEEGDREVLLIFFLEGVATIAHQGFQIATQLLELFKKDIEKVKRIQNAAPSVLEVHRFFQFHPVSSVRRAQKSLSLSIPTLHAPSKQLVRFKIFKKLCNRGKAHLHPQKV